MIDNVTDIDRSSDLGTRARRAAARLVAALARLGRDTRGATMVEYAVLVGLLSAGAITLIVATGDTMSRPWTALAESLPGASEGTVPGDTAAADGPAATGGETGGGSGGGSGNGTSVADGADTGGDSSPNGGGQGGDSGDSGEFDVAAATGGDGGASSGGGGGSAAFGGGGTSGAGGAGSTGGSSGGGQSGGSAATSGSGQSSESAATSGGGGGSASTSSGGGGGAGGGGSAGSAGLAGGYGASGGADGGGGGGSQGGAGAAMAEADPAPYSAAETETGTMQASLVWQAKSLGTALLAEAASGEMGAALLAMGGQGAGSTVAVLEDMAQGKHPWLALLFVLTLIAAFYAIAKRTKSARFKKRMLAIADHRWD